MSLVRRIVLAAIAAWALLLLAGCGGGGGGTPPPTTLVDLTGNVIWIRTGAGPSPAATVRAGDRSTTADVTDGFFSLRVPAGTASLTVTYTPGGGSPIVRTFAFQALTGDTDLGEVYIGPSTVDVTGTVLDSATNAPVAGAVVTLAGRRAVANASGQFRVPDVAFDSASLAVFLGLQGRVQATGYFDGVFSPPSGPVGGVVAVGPVRVTPLGGDDPPPAPFNISGSVLPVADGPGATVTLLQGTTVIRTTRADGTGRYFFWAAAGTYTVRATKGSLVGTAPVTLTAPNVPVSVNVTLN